MEAGKKSEPLPAGTGELDYPALFQILYQRKPWVDVLLEDCSPSSAGQALDFVRSLAATLESTGIAERSGTSLQHRQATGLV